MNLSNSSMEMNESLKVMSRLWDETKEVWNDSVRHAFEEQKWHPLQLQVQSTLRAMERLAPVIEKLHHDCGLPASSEW
jgi:hypothetical protein